MNLDNNKTFYVSLGIKTNPLFGKKLYYYLSDFHSGFIYLFSLRYSFLSYNEEHSLFSFFLFICFLLPEKYFSYVINSSCRCIHFATVNRQLLRFKTHFEGQKKQPAQP